MPDPPDPKERPHPWRLGAGDAGAHAPSPPDAAGAPARAARSIRRADGPAYAELHVTTNFTFLTGASHPEEFVRRAAALGHRAAAIADRNTLAGIVRAHVAAKEAGVPLAVGCRIELAGATPPCTTTSSAPDPPRALRLAAHNAVTTPRLTAPLSILTYATDRASYGRLCRLLTLGKRRTTKGECALELHDVIEHAEGLLGVVIPPGDDEAFSEHFVDLLLGLRRAFGGSREDRLSLAASCLRRGDDRERLERLAALARHTDIPLAATNDAHYHDAARRPLQDVLTCVRHTCTIEEAGLRLFPNAERRLKSPEEMARLFADHPGALTRSADIALRAAAFSLDQLRYEYPDEVVPAGSTPMRHLAALTYRGGAERYPAGVPAKVRAQIEHELRLIEELDYAPYFLTVHDLVTFARSRGILCQGRGAAANSAVCYCLGVTAVDPDRIDVLFERFVSKERDEPPDIDIDFEHERREEVIQYIYGKYGRDRAALTAEVISYRGRSAIRDVGKAMGLSLDCVDRLAKSMDWWDRRVVRPQALRDLGLNPDDPTLRTAIALAGEVLGFPRHLSQHVGGFVITRGPLSECVPIENAAMDDRTVIEWDKDDIDALGMLKVDVLGLGMLTCIRKCFELVNGAGRSDEATERRSDGGEGKGLERGGGGEAVASERQLRPSIAAHIPSSLRRSVAPSLLQLHTIPSEDPAVYDMVCRADTVGVFQIESRAQMSMLPRLRPRRFYDLVIEVAIVRPGPIQGNMVHPYLRRRNGEEAVTYPDDAVRAVLAKTLGVPLFQEQAMSLAMVAGGFTAGEADQLRRAMAAWKRKGDAIYRFGEKLVRGMLARGYPSEFAERCFEQIKGFSEYGFPESHAASFALLVYVSAWLKRRHPAAFAAAILNSQPMGFYAPAQLVRDAREHGVEVREVDVNRSDWDCCLEESDGEQRRSDGATERRRGSEEGWRDEGEPASWGVGGPAVRLGFRLVRGMREEEGRAVAAAVRRAGAFRTVRALWRASGVRVETLRRLAAADAFRSMGLDRQRALWETRALRDDRLPMFDGVEDPPRPQTPTPAASSRAPASHSPSAPLDDPLREVHLPPVPPARQVILDYGAVGLSLKAHPVSFLRPGLRSRRIVPAAALRDERLWPTGRRVAVAGLVLVRQRPSTASGIVFMTLEDETGVANLIVRPRVYDRFRRVARHSVVMLARGVVERQGEVVHVMVRRIEDLSDEAAGLLGRSRDFH